MAKVPFSKLQAKVNSEIVKLSFANASGEDIEYEVKCYLPLQEKLILISDIINQSVDDNGFYNPMRVKLFTVLEIIYRYTNLSFTEKMKEDPFKLYDILISTKIFENVINVIIDWEEIQNNIYTTIDNIYKYQNSIMGILDTIKEDYSNLDLDATKIQQKLSNSENVEFLKDVLDKLG